MLNDIRRHDSPSLDSCIKLLNRGPDKFTQLIDILIEAKQNNIVIMLLTTNWSAILQGKKNMSNDFETSHLLDDFDFHQSVVF